MLAHSSRCARASSSRTGALRRPRRGCSALGVVELTLHEGRKRQVKRMLEAVGHPVRRLHRSGYAGLGVEGLEPGEWRELSRDEVAELRRTAGSG